MLEHQNLRRVLSGESLMGRVYWAKPTGRGDHRTRVRRDGTPKYGPTVLIQLEPLIDPERFDALQIALARRAYGEKAPAKIYPLSGAATACGGRIGGVYRRDRDLRQYRCNRAKWQANGAPRCDCARLDAEAIEGRVWEQVCALLADPERLLAMADEYLGVRGPAAEGETDRLAELDRKIVELERARMKSAKDAIKAGLDPELVRAVVEEIETELGQLQADRARIEAIRADEQAAEERAVSIARLAERAAHRLPGMGLEEQREVLALLGVRIELLDQTANPALRIEGDLPGGGDDLFGPGNTPSDPDDGPDLGPITPRVVTHEYAHHRAHIRRLGIDASHLPRAGAGSPRTSRWFRDEDLIEAVRLEWTVHGVLRRFGYSTSGGMFRYVVAHIRRLDLDTSHFRGQAWARGLRRPSTKVTPLEQVLVKGSTTTSGNLRKRLIAAGIKPAHCEECELSEWRDKRLPLCLDHINGDHTDNRLENLRILCPNCHAITDTWCGRNRKPA